MAQKLESGPLQIQHGHTETHVIFKFSRPTDHVLLTPQQADEFCASVQAMKGQLAAHVAGRSKPSS